MIKVIQTVEIFELSIFGLVWTNISICTSLVASENICIYIMLVKKEVSTAVLDCHCGGRPFLRMPLLISSTGPIASRSHQATTCTWLAALQISASGVDSQLCTSCCLVTYRHGPVLLMKSGILQKGLPAQWQSYTAVKTQSLQRWGSFSTVYSIPDRWNWFYIALVAPFVGPDSPFLCCALRGTRWHFMPLRWTFVALRCRDHRRSSLPKSFLLYYIMLAVHECDEG